MSRYPSTSKARFQSAAGGVFRPARPLGRGYAGPQGPAPSLWQALARDRYALVVFVGCLGLFLAGISDLSHWVHPYRWYFVSLLAVATLGIVARAPWLPQRPEHYSLYALMAVSALSCAISPMPDYSFQRLASFVLMFLGVFVGAWIWLQRPENVRLVAHMLLVPIAIGVAFSLVELAEMGSLLPGQRVTGAFGKATGTGSFAAASLPLVLWKRHYTRGRWRWAYDFMLVVLVYLLVFSGARAATVAGLTACAVWTWKHHQLLRPAIAVTCVLLGGLAVSGVVTLEMLPDYIVRKETIPTFTGRIPRWKAGLEMWAESPVIGHGYGMTRYATMIMNEQALKAITGDDEGGKHAAFLRRAVEARRPVTMTLHSDHVERLAETGVLGYAGFAAFWFFVLRRLQRLLWLRMHEQASLALALGLNVGYVFVNSFMHGAMFAIGAAGTTVTWLGIVVFLAASEQIEWRRPAQS